MYHLTIDPQQKTPKYKQIIASIIADIERNILKKNEQLPSITELSEEYYISKDTVEKAYKILNLKGFVTAIRGKGFFVNGPENRKIQILLVLNKLSSYKKRIYYSFLKVLEDKAIVDLHIHHYNAKVFENIIDSNLGRYNYYVIMPLFASSEDKALIYNTLDRIPINELVLLDKDLPERKYDCLSIFQDFERDVLNALEGAKDLLDKYTRLVLIFPNDGNYPEEIIRGIRYYCIGANKDFIIREHLDNEILVDKTVYLVIEENDLASLIKNIRASNFKIGENIGIVSFNDTTLKELLGITVVTTDFEEMGKTAATMILNHQKLKVKNPFYMIRRESL